MILLVWNSLATADLVLREGLPGIPPASGESSGSDTPPIPQNPPETANPRMGPLSARQNYLIGKQIDINAASKEEFNSLPGISDAMAVAIVEERARMGGFRSLQDLTRVRGIKQKRLEKILPFLKKMENN